MSAPRNSIRGVSTSVARLDPAQADIVIGIDLELVSAGTEIRGRLMGPRCPGSTTIEVAYPLREERRDKNRVLARVIIPEPSLWDPQTPFRYEGAVELWQDGQRCDQTVVRVGLKAPRGGPP